MKMGDRIKERHDNNGDDDNNNDDNNDGEDENKRAFTVSSSVLVSCF